MAANDFIQWALDPARPVEEAYVAECLLGPALGRWRYEHKVSVPFDWEKISAARKQRKLNPAYRPTLDPQDVKRAAECLSSVESLNLGNSDDRPIRLLAGIEFVPNLKTLFLHGVGVRGWARLAALTPLAVLP